MAIVYLGLGSNLGDCKKNLHQTLIHLQQQVTLLAVSPVLQTKPMYVTTQPDFYNQIVKGETSLSPLMLLKFLKEIEEKMGRLPTYRYGPRVIDIDILFYDDLLFETADLQIPHPKNNERLFILELMCELDPLFVCPRTRQIIKDLLRLAS